ncbi:ABC transporter periplasmic protein [Sphingomonas sp. MM-1]|uniref:ABC transporter substrate-binding protein n=1 Tax=Sphingomonas sp. MM-1 TaxID=745310 RepID=UPI0002C06FB8|nr:ABC transporter substrate-binding protein [Sphingomonas sp. MM-1]AGH50842.1 ABC transporter periplasmic protein [Sphingomonas sp. MM-1]
MHMLSKALVLLAGAIGLGAVPAGAAAPRRIVSLNLCADQYLLALADPGQIAALTQFARDPAMSAAAGKVGDIRQSTGSAEEVLALQPDLVIASPSRRRETVAILKARNLPILSLPSAQSYADIVSQVRQVAGAIGHPERGEALIHRMDQALARLRPAPGAPVAAYYQRRGYLTGSGTLIDDLMTRAGAVNLAGRLGRPALSQLSVEEMVAARPDYLIVDGDGAATDLGTEMLQHPALAAIPRVHLPMAWTVCGGPAYVLAAESLSRQLSPRPSARYGDVRSGR